MTDERLGPTPEQRRKSLYERVRTSDIDPSEQEITTTLKNRGTSALDRWHSVGVVDDRQYAAGAWFQRTWYFAGLEPSVTQNLLRVSGSGESSYGMAASERQAYHRQLYRAAISALGTRLAPVMINALCFDMSAEVLGERYGASNKSRAKAIGVDRIRLGLDTLDDWLQELARQQRRKR